MRNTNFGLAAGARAGFVAYLPVSVGLIPWALVVGMAMTSVGFTTAQAMGMNIIVFAGTAQLGTLPLIAADAPLWLIIATALALNLRFLIFSAAISPGFHGARLPTRWLSGHLLTDGVFATCLDRMLQVDDLRWRLGYPFAILVLLVSLGLVFSAWSNAREREQMLARAMACESGTR